MKLHIEVLQEKVDSMTKDREGHKRELDKVKNVALQETEKLCKLIKTLEEELNMKAEKFKSLESKSRDEQLRLSDKLKVLKVQYDKLKD